MARPPKAPTQTTPLTDDDNTPPDLQTLKRYFTESEQLTQSARANSLTAIDYYDSDQFTAAELQALKDRGQPAIVVNRIKPAVNGIIGVTEKGRSDPRCWPRNPGDEDTADAATDVLRYIADFNRFKRIKQDCFRDMLVPGSMAALIGVDGDKQVIVTQVRWEEFFHDPRSRRNDFKDARYLGVAKWMYQDDLAALYPEKAKEIDASVNTGPSGIMPDQSYQDRPLQGSAIGGAWIDKKQRRLMVVEMYYQDSARWMRCVFTGTDILEAGPSPYTDHKGKPDCPIEAMSAYVRRDNGRYGAVWDMIGPQDEVNKRRSKALHLLSTSRIEAKDPSAINVDAEVARKEAARPDGVLPFGWGMSPNTAEFTGNMELLQEAKSEIERMGPNPATLGRSDDQSGRHLLIRQQSGLVELANLYGALEDWELRVYRQCWARAKQFWKAPQWIRVTDDADAPKFVGLNMPIQPGDPDDPTAQPTQPGMQPMQPGAQPQQPPQQPVDPAQAMMGTGTLGYRNVIGEMDIDIEIDTQPDTGTIQQEAFNELMQLVGASPLYQQQVPLSTLIQLSPIPHKRSVLDVIKQASDQQQQTAAQAQQIAQATATAKLQEIEAKTAELQAKPALHAATGFAKASDALTYAHQAHSDSAVAGLEKGLDAGAQDQAQNAAAQGQASDQAHASDMQTSQQAAAANQAQTDQ